MFDVNSDPYVFSVSNVLFHNSKWRRIFLHAMYSVSRLSIYDEKKQGVLLFKELSSTYAIADLNSRFSSTAMGLFCSLYS